MSIPPVSMMTERRRLIFGAGAALIAAMTALPSTPAQAAPFLSQRMTMKRRGTLGPGGRDVILIAGLASGPAIWNDLPASMPGHRFHLVHIAGFAGLPVGGNASGPLLTPLVSELARYIDTQPLRAPAIIGHSMGGMLSMMLALRPTPKINRIIVVDMLPEGAAMLGGTAGGIGFLAGQLNGYLTGTKAGRQMLAQMVMQTPGAQDSDPQVIAQALTELGQINLRPRLGSITCPMQIIYALPNDKEMAAAQRQRYQSAYANARSAVLTPIGPSGHMIMQDQPEKFKTLVQKFLK